MKTVVFALEFILVIALSACSNKTIIQDFPTKTVNGSSSPLPPERNSNETTATSTPDTTVAPTLIDKHILLFHSDRTGSYQIYTSDTSGNNVKQLTNSPGRNIEPAMSPDGSMIAFSSSRDDQNGLYLFLMKGDGSAQHVLITKPGYALSPKWSPDGKRLIFYTNWDEHFQIYTVDVATGKYERFITSSDIDYLPSWSPDGKRIAYTSRRGTSEQIHIINSDKTGDVTISVGTEWAWRPNWSPDGTQIVYFKWTSNNGDLFLYDTRTKATVQLTSTSTIPEQNPSWSTDGSKIYFDAKLLPDQIDLFRMNPDGTGIEQLTHNVKNNGYPSEH